MRNNFERYCAKTFVFQIDSFGAICYHQDTHWEALLIFQDHSVAYPILTKGKHGRRRTSHIGEKNANDSKTQVGLLHERTVP